MSNEGTFGQRLKALLKRARLSQQQIADELDIPRNTVWRWLNDKATPESNNLQRLATLLQVSVDELMNGSPEQPGQWVLQIRIAHEFREEVIDMRRGIPRKASITTTPEGGYLCLGGDYTLWTDDNNFKKFIADIKKFRETVIQNGIALGGIAAQ